MWVLVSVAVGKSAAADVRGILLEEHVVIRVAEESWLRLTIPSVVLENKLIFVDGT